MKENDEIVVVKLRLTKSQIDSLPPASSLAGRCLLQMGFPINERGGYRPGADAALQRYNESRKEPTQKPERRKRRSRA
jgi:hypothetical protein